MSDEITKEYTNGEITVVWKPATCIHSKKCWKGLSSVFNPTKKPWVNIAGSPSEVIMKQIDACPTGALSYYINNEGKSELIVSAVTKVEVIPNGPIRVLGDVEVNHSNGTVEHRERITAFCRCGLSANKPFCDGSHKREGWSESA